ncbi:TetR/AcrR family transcriptional regulator [Bradyrhizobium genosp. L]|uniref:TetR/AcrR family transcriptional regulator n=1 Tax=Bradyrhizobium genosp. L TaxID=83637 RepID=UPI0018A2A691|nr:TetR/AcrR family transcriptional regulator [Bradyrhizobium genosp. L]QPF86229.1 TetR/AcrR family transcriptional regulator [Bradyrhizobium genosp. L]
MVDSRVETADDATPRRGRPRSAATTAAILQAAYTLMATTGLAATTIDAIARHSGVSKMTVYKWWPSREALLIDAFLDQASRAVPIAGTGTPIARIRRHVASYVGALQGEVGRVQLAVISECISKTGSAEMFYDRYLSHRRSKLLEIIVAGQSDGSIGASGAPGDLYDAIYGSLFYRSIFGIAPLTPAYARNLVNLVLRPNPDL